MSIASAFRPASSSDRAYRSSAWARRSSVRGDVPFEEGKCLRPWLDGNHAAVLAQRMHGQRGVQADIRAHVDERHVPATVLQEELDLAPLIDAQREGAGDDGILLIQMDRRGTNPCGPRDHPQKGRIGQPPQRPRPENSGVEKLGE